MKVHLLSYIRLDTTIKGEIEGKCCATIGVQHRKQCKYCEYQHRCKFVNINKQINLKHTHTHTHTPSNINKVNHKDCEEL